MSDTTVTTSLPSRRLVIRTRDLELTGDFVGWRFTARMNPTLYTLAELSSKEFERIIAAMTQIVRAWNFVDEEGKDMPAPSEESVGQLPTDLLNAMIARYNEELSALPKT